MKKVVTLYLLFISSVLMANHLPLELKNGSITGKVIDKDLKEPIAYAAIVIKSANDNKTITGGITKEDGSFEIKKLPEGNLLFEIQFIGYKTYSKKITISKNNYTIALGTIYLEENAEQLDGVELIAERTTIVQKVDRKVINVGKDLTTAGATASDIMNNIPSVNVDQQSGALSLRGNPNVRVMVDGKLSNVPVAQLLKQLPSTSIKSIELITNPSAKYNPEGMSGIINIVLHKNANIGFNGSINTGLTVDEEAKFNSSIDLNYRNGKFNIYGNYGNNIGKYVNRGRIHRIDQNSNLLFNFNNNNKSHLYKIGIDFFLNDKNTISFFTNQNTFDGKGSSLNSVLFNNNSNNLVQSTINLNDNKSQQYNFDYKLEFKKDGHNIELEIDRNNFKSGDDVSYVNSGASVFPNYKDFTNTKREQTIANLDYVNPIDSISKLEVGLEARIFETNKDYNSTGFSFNSSGSIIPTPSSDFVYKMDIYSAYATFGQKYKKWSYQVGARIEDVSIKADTNTVRTFTDKYTQIYPSAFITYSPTEKNQFQISTSRRVDRPGLGQVNPIRQWSTPLVSSFGNPALVPQFTNSYELNYTRRLKKGSITTGVFYRTIKDNISRSVSLDRTDLESARTILSFGNFDKTSAYGIEFSTNYKPLKWWSINGSFDLFSQTQTSISERLVFTNSTPTEDDIIEENVEIDNTTWNLRMSNSFTVTKKLTLQAFGMYRGKNKGVQFTRKPMSFVNIGARHSFAQGKGTVSVNYNDIFNTMRFAFEGERPFRQVGQFNWESQTVNVALSYRFGSGKNKASKRKRRDNNTKQAGGGMM